MSAKIGSQLAIATSTFANVVNNLHSRTIERQRTGTLVQSHNAYTAYNMLLMFAATGHRPCRDAFCRIDHMSVETESVLIEDKVVSESHRYRLVPLAALACRQLEQYFNHLRRLRIELLDSRKPMANAIEQLFTNGDKGKQLIPSFFFLDERLYATRSVRPNSLAFHLGDLWPFPFNTSRHRLASTLFEAGFDADDVYALLGHIHAGHHPLGKQSMHTVNEWQARVRFAVQGMLDNEGWRVIESAALPRIERGQIPPRISQKRIHESVLLGPERRERKREKGLQRDADVVRVAMTSLDYKKDLANTEKLRAAVQQILAASIDTPDRANRRLALFYRYLWRLRFKYTVRLPQRVFVPTPENSPFGVNTLAHYQLALVARAEFISHLDASGRDAKSVSGEERTAEIVVSAALFGMISSTKHLQRLGNATFYRLEKRVIADLPFDNGEQSFLPYRRWFLDDVSRLLVEADSPRSSAKYGERGTAALRQLVASLGATPKEAQRPLHWLTRMSRAFWLLHCHGFLRAIAFGQQAHQALPITTLVRVVTDRRLKYFSPKMFTESVSVSWRPPVPKKGTVDKPATHAFHRKLVKLLGDVNRVVDRHMAGHAVPSPFDQDISVVKRGSETATTIKKRIVVKRLKHQYLLQHDITPTAYAVILLVVHLCENGTRYKARLAFSTVMKYGGMASLALAEQAGDLPFLDLHEADYEAVYEQCVAYAAAGKGSDAERQNELARVLGELHACLVEYLGVDPVRIPFRSQTEDLPNIDANVVTGAEYERALHLLNTNQAVSILEQALDALALICGVRLGLRVGETFGLRRKDIQVSADLSTLVFYVVPTRQRTLKTRAARRIVPLQQLSELERSVLKQVIARGDLIYKESPSSTLFVNDTVQGAIIDRAASVLRIHLALRQVTGDPTVRYHHCRHSYANRESGALLTLAPEHINASLFDGLLAPNSNYSDGGGGRLFRPLLGLSRNIGHARPPTTLSSYWHLSDAALGDIARSTLRPEMSDYALAYMLQCSNSTIRQRRRRTGIPPGALVDLHLLIDRSRILPPPIETVPHPASEQLFSDSVPRNVLSLAQTDKLLELSAENKAFDGLYRSLMTTERCVDRIAAAASELERLSGYTQFQLTNHDMSNVSSTFVDSHEKNRVRTTLKLWEAIWLDSTIDRQSCIALGLEAWADAHDNRTSQLLLTPTSIENYFSGMAELGLSTSLFDVFIPANASHSDIAYLEQVVATLEITSKRSESIRRRQAKLPAEQTQRIGVSLTKGAHHLGYQRSLNRALFVFLTGIQADTIPS